MFRATAFLAVLTLAAGPEAALLCGAWCDQGGRIASACQHETAANSPIVSANDCCDDALGVPVVLFKLRLNLSAPDGAQATEGSRHQFALQPLHRSPGQESTRHGSFDNRPLATILRI